MLNTVTVVHDEKIIIDRIGNRMGILTKAIAIAGFSAMTSLVSATPINLGAAGSYTLLSAGELFPVGGTMILGSEAQIWGDVGARNYLSTAPGVKIHGNLHGGYINASPGLVVDGETLELSDSEWDVIFSDLEAAVFSAASLGGSLLSSVNSTQVLTASGSGLDAFIIDGDIHLAGGDTLTLSGSAIDEFVINITGNFFLGGGSAIQLDGVLSSNVLFNFLDVGCTANVAAGSFAGTYISSGCNWILGDGLILAETQILAGNIPTANLQDVIGVPVTVTVPEPSSIVLMLMSLFGLTLIRKKTI